MIVVGKRYDCIIAFLYVVHKKVKHMYRNKNEIYEWLQNTLIIFVVQKYLILSEVKLHILISLILKVIDRGSKLEKHSMWIEL